ncbi:DUF6941 family protein [Rhodococcoides kroppenstedtii]|uniref:DUF6941 family protein n=1 Tax=Rhodococcoides kroppenstedtii TaxID=293050 RepID=UPI001427A13B|nr:hypothetical protein [Rhodococcus kroppenstedtii]
MTDIDAEAITFAVALDAWKSDHDAMAAVNKAAEWFQRHAETQAVNDPSSWNSATSMSSMVVTGAFHSDVARSSDGKLDVLGGVWDHATVDYLPIEVPVNLVMICQTGSDDVGEVRSTTAELVRPGAEPEPWFVITATIDAAENRFFYVSTRLPLGEPGRHVVRLTVGDNELTARSVSLDVRI